MARISKADARRLGLEPKENKYRVAAKEDRTYGGVVYDSKAEAEYAAQLELRRRGGDIAWWFRQVPVRLSSMDDKTPLVTKVDFLIRYSLRNGNHVEAHEVKGKETREWRFIRRRWPQYGPVPLVVIRGGKVVERIEPDGQGT